MADDRFGLYASEPGCELDYASCEATSSRLIAVVPDAAPVPRDSSALNAETVEILAVLLKGRAASIRRMGITPRTLISFVEEWGNPSTVYSRFASPVYEWMKRENQSDVTVIVIDRGSTRVRVVVPLRAN
ncbi:hypothetical protein [Pseudoxanthomonas sp. UTMC 1351]|uniref:hypothetical protein n=1 Tax=Pseudoxanthomonas sp. UTMC 1351 TaxID=2695853 RepID=UPI0034CDEFE7